MTTQIINSNYAKGDGNTQVIIAKDNQIEWDAILALLGVAQQKAVSCATHKVLLNEAVDYCKKKDAPRFISFLRKNSSAFLSGTMQNLLGGILTHILLGFIN